MKGYRWSIKTKDDVHRIYHLVLTRTDRGEPYHVTAVRYQAWAFGACSMAAVWKWDNIPANEEMLAMFLRDALLPMHDSQDWECKRIFCQVPAGGKYNEWDEQVEIPFFKLLRETIFPDLQPAYTFENLSHKSTEQRLFDLSIPVMRTWMENYYAEQKAGGNGDPNVRTIIAEPIDDLFDVKF